MNKNEIEDKIIGILINDFQVPKERIRSDSKFKEDLRLDSLEVVDFIMLLQKDFKFKSPLEAYRELHNLSMLVDFVSSQIRQ